MLFVFAQPFRPTFDMTGMACPVDLLWLGAGGTVLGGVQGAPPGSRHPAPFPVTLVLEAAAGTVARGGIRVGTRYEIQGTLPVPR